jgi:hypothetical protein
MTGAPTERWRQVEELLAAALDREPAAREKFLDAACAGDSNLRREVESLLAAHERSGALDRLAPEVASITAELRGASAMLAGRTIGHYQVVDRVGGGGMGVIYKAIDTRLGRTVALKFIKPRLDADASSAERFRQEARAAGALEHPNICTIHDIGETEDGRLYLAMPLYDGETLEQRIARGPLAIGDQRVGVEARLDELERDRASESRIQRFVDDGHPTVADLLEHAVAPDGAPREHCRRLANVRSDR